MEFSGTVTGDGDLNLASYNNNTGTFKVSGTATGYTGAITSDSHITLNVANGGSLNVATGSNLAGAVALDGTMNVTGNATISGAVSGSGSINVNAGTLALGSSITTSGTVSVAAGAGITFANGATISANSFDLGSGSKLDFSDYKGTVGSKVSVVTTSTGVTGYSGASITGPVAPRGMTATVAQEENDIVLTFQAKEDATMHLYVLTGQSNSLGAVKDSPLNATMLAAYQSEGLLWNGNMNKDSGVRFETDPTWQIVAPQKPDGSGYNNNPCMGPEYGFSYIMQNKGWTELLGENDTLAVVKGSLDGGGNHYWLQDANAYKSLLGSVKESIQDAVALGFSNISLDGLMYLQGESNNAEEASLASTRFTDFVGYLKSDLESWLTAEGLEDVTLSFDGNTVTGEPRLGSDARQTTETQLLELATSNNMINADKNGKGHVLTNDLAVTNCDGQNVHYTGNSQLTIGARYAYAFAVQKGIDVGAVRGQDDSKTLDQAGAWWMEKLPGENEVATWDISSVSTVNNIADGATLTVGGIKIDEVYRNGATDKGQGSIAINGGAISLGAGGINLVGGNLSITSGVTVRESQTWQAADGHKLAVNGTTTISGNAKLTMKDGLYLTFGAITGTGNLEIGTVTFDMNLDYMLANGLGKYRTSTQEVAENGFFMGGLDLMKLTGETSAITFTGVDGSVGKNITTAGDLADYTLQLSDDKKALQLIGLHLDEETYFTRKGEVTYTDTDTAQYGIYTAKQVMLSGSVDQPATLKLASALKEGVTIQASGLGGTVNIVDGVTLAAASVNAAGGPVVLAGEGTFALSANTVALPTNVTLADAANWHGTVKIANTSGTAGYDIKLNALGNENSAVEFENVTAYLNTASTTYTPNIRLTGEGLNIDAGSTDGTYTFNGDVTGSGKLNLSLSRGSDRHTYVFAGDVEGWNGEILAPSNKTLTVKFTGEADTVNAKITKTNGTLNLVADAATTFKAALTGLNSFTVNGSKSASVLGGIGTNTTTLNAGASLTIGGTANSTLGTVTLNNNTALTIGGSGTVTASNVKVGDQCAATITLGNDFSMEQLDTIGANKTLSIASAEGEAKTLTTGQLGFDNVGTVISLQNVDMVVTGAATAGVLDAHSNNKGTMTVGANATLDLRGTTQWNTSDSKYVDLVVKDGGAVSVTGGTENKIRNVELGTGGTNASLSFGAETHTAIANTNVAAGAHATVNGNGAGNVVDFGNVNVNANAEMKVMNMGDAATVSVSDVTIGAGATMGVYTGTELSSIKEADLVIASGKALTAIGNATLNANLVMATGSTLDVTGTDGLGLAMGSTVTLNEGMLLNGYSSTWSAWEDGTTYTLFTGVDGLDVTGSMSSEAINYTAWLDASKYFTNITEVNRYFLCYDGAPAANSEGSLTGVGTNGSNVGMVYIMVMPEPTTGTLSLLALVALAARRRRK